MSRERRRIGIIVGAIAVILLATALVLPNFFRGGITDCRITGGTTILMLHTAEVTYATSYPDQGYAPNLAALGPDRLETANIACQPTAARACLIDAKLGCAAGGTGWCVDRLYRYNIQSSSSKPPYRDYWITATPIQASPENKNYCSTLDVILRSETSLPLSRPYTLAQCKGLKVDSYDPDKPGTSN